MPERRQQQREQQQAVEHVDVLVVGAGLSGVGAASMLRRQMPAKQVVILESRGTIGGTWDLFRYPGVRSDSDMFTLGYSFRPWRGAKAIADGDSIRDYIRATVADEGLAPSIRLHHRVLSAEWSSETARWTVTVLRTGAAEHRAGDEDAGDARTVRLTCSFLSICSGYYRYDQGYTPAIPGLDDFGGTLVHPQRWPQDLDHSDQRVVIVGSGATAVTLVPSMAATAAHVTMLQRSPTYIAPVPSRDRVADRLRRVLPERVAYRAARAKSIASSMLVYQLARRRPELTKRFLRKAALARLPEGFDAERHLTPTYQPWDQRLCAVPDGDLFRAIADGRADIVTDTIARVTRTGIELTSGRTLDADVIVTATGLDVLAIGGIRLVVDGEPVDVARRLTYKGMMLADVPNLSLTIGYTNASWTLKADLVAQYVVRLLRRMDRRGFDIVTPRAPAAVDSGETVSLIDLEAGYILRSAGALPRQGMRTPWRLHQSYLRDLALLRLGRVTDDVRFGRRGDVAVDVVDGVGWVDVGGTRLRYRRTGPGSGTGSGSTGSATTVLLLHGIGRSIRDWDEQHELLAEHHDVVSLDLPGFGSSERLPGAATLDGLAGVLPAFLDAIGVDGPVAVVGNSMGGAVAMTFAAANPQRVSSLVLADPAGFGSEVSIALRLLGIRPLAARLMAPSLEGSARVVRSLFWSREHATEQRIRQAYALAQRPAHQQTTLDMARDLGTLRGVRPQWRRRLLASLARHRIPILVVWGEADRVLPATHLAAVSTAFPDAEVRLLPETGHMPQIERADEFAQLVVGFVDRHAAGGAEVAADASADAVADAAARSTR